MYHPLSQRAENDRQDPERRAKNSRPQRQVTRHQNEEDETHIGDTGQSEIEPVPQGIVEPVIDHSYDRHRNGKGSEVPNTLINAPLYHPGYLSLAQFVDLESGIQVQESPCEIENCANLSHVFVHPPYR